MQQTRAASDGQRHYLEQRQETFEGLLPYPDHLARYEQILPGASDRIMQMAEIEQAKVHSFVEADHRFRADVLKARISENRWKHVTALIALALCLFTAGFLAYVGAYAAAGAVGGTTVLGVVGSFLAKEVRGRHEGSQEKPSKPAGAKPKAKK